MEENVVEIIESLLDDNWNSYNVKKPQILRQWNPKRVDMAKDDAVILYETSGLMKEPGDLTYFSEDVNGFVSVDIRTVKSESRFKALYTEIERIRKLKRKNPHTDYDRWDFVRKTLFHRPLSWRAVVDYKLSKANQSIN
jgi:hypothetical protein